MSANRFANAFEASKMLPQGFKRPPGDPLDPIGAFWNSKMSPKNPQEAPAVPKRNPK